MGFLDIVRASSMPAAKYIPGSGPWAGNHPRINPGPNNEQPQFTDNNRGASPWPYSIPVQNYKPFDSAPLQTIMGLARSVMSGNSERRIGYQATTYDVASIQLYVRPGDLPGSSFYRPYANTITINAERG